MVIASLRGERTIPLEAFFKGPGETVLQPGELLTQIIVPHPPARSGSSYTRHTPRAQMDIAVVGVEAVEKAAKSENIAKRLAPWVAATGIAFAVTGIVRNLKT